MKRNMKKMMWKPSLAVPFLFVGVMAILLFAAASAQGIPFGFDGNEKREISIDIPPATTTYSLVQCVEFQTLDTLRKVCSDPGSEVSASEEDIRAFEDTFHLMMVFAREEDIPPTSWLTILSSRSSQNILVQLSNGYSVYAIGAGDTFALAMNNLIDSFFSHEDIEEEGEENDAPTRATQKVFDI